MEIDGYVPPLDRGGKNETAQRPCPASSTDLSSSLFGTRRRRHPREAGRSESAVRDVYAAFRNLESHAGKSRPFRERVQNVSGRKCAHGRDAAENRSGAAIGHQKVAIDDMSELV